jgi:translation initiation factor IF-2
MNDKRNEPPADGPGRKAAPVQGAPRGRTIQWHEGPLLLVAAVVVLLVALGSAFGFGLLTKTARSGAAQPVGSPTRSVPGHSSTPSQSQTPANSPEPSGSPTPTAVPAGTGTPAGAGALTAIAGFGCPSGRQAQFSLHGQYTQGILGYVKVKSGGWKSQGCDGTFEALPMSGSATKPYPGNYALWTFRPAGVRSCGVSVFVPDDHSITHVGGNPARYLVYDAAAQSGNPAGRFAVDQAANLGRWVRAGQFPVRRGVLTIELTSIGVDWNGKTRNNRHLAADAVRLSCAR